ncbi:MAG: hypothetical protein IT372_02855 [Polyangiaceae bacterium]|nr:hypothetical protein [Polyangiaceae bacterium]
MLKAWLSAFLFTQVVEVPIYRGLAGTGWLPAFGASALTHPIVWFVIPSLWRDNYWGMVALAETFAVVAEAIYLGVGFGVKHPLRWSLLANAASAGLGLASRAAFGWP